MNDTSIHITDNINEQRFETPLDNDFAFISYRWESGNLSLMHTEVPEAYEGKGIASKLAQFAFETAKRQQRKILVFCPYITTWLKRHPEYNELVQKDYNI